MSEGVNGGGGGAVGVESGRGRGQDESGRRYVGSGRGYMRKIDSTGRESDDGVGWHEDDAEIDEDALEVTSRLGHAALRRARHDGKVSGELGRSDVARWWRGALHSVGAGSVADDVAGDLQSLAVLLQPLGRRGDGPVRCGRSADVCVLPRDRFVVRRHVRLHCVFDAPVRCHRAHATR